MKLNKYFLIGAMGLSLFACSDELNENGNQDGSIQNGEMTYAAIRFDFDSHASRATDYGDGKLPGTGTAGEGSDEEKAIKSIRLIITDSNDNIEYIKSFTEPEDLLPTKVHCTKLQAGDKKFYAFINERNADGDTGKKYFDSYKIGDKWSQDEKILEGASYFYDLTKQNGMGFVMSGSVEYPIVAGVTEEEVQQANNTKNAVSIDVERTVAKVTVHLADDYDNDQNAKDYKVTVHSLAAAIGNADLKQVTGTAPDQKTTMWGTYATAYDVNGVRQSPGFTAWTDNNPDDATDDLAYSNTFIRWNNQPTSATGDALWPKGTDSKYPVATYYCLENTHEVGKYKKGNTTFTRIIAEMIPTAATEFTYEGGELGVTDADKDNLPDKPASFYTIDGVPTGESTDLIKNYVLKTHLIGLYTTLEGVLDEKDKTAVGDESDPGKQDDLKATAVINYLETQGFGLSEEYVGGKGYFYTWVNHLKNHGYVNTAPVFRNDWYDLSITRIILPGEPTEGFGEGGGGEDIDPDTWLSVKLTVKPWNMIDHEVTLQ